MNTPDAFDHLLANLRPAPLPEALAAKAMKVAEIMHAQTQQRGPSYPVIQPQPISQHLRTLPGQQSGLLVIQPGGLQGNFATMPMYVTPPHLLGTLPPISAGVGLQASQIPIGVGLGGEVADYTGVIQPNLEELADQQFGPIQAKFENPFDDLPWDCGPLLGINSSEKLIHKDVYDPVSKKYVDVYEVETWLHFLWCDYLVIGGMTITKDANGRTIATRDKTKPVGRVKGVKRLMMGGKVQVAFFPIGATIPMEDGAGNTINVQKRGIGITVSVPDCTALRVIQIVKTKNSMTYCDPNKKEDKEDKPWDVDVNTQREADRNTRRGYDSEGKNGSKQTLGFSFDDTPADHNMIDELMALGVKIARSTDSFKTFLCCEGKFYGVIRWSRSRLIVLECPAPGQTFAEAPVVTDSQDGPNDEESDTASDEDAADFQAATKMSIAQWCH